MKKIRIIIILIILAILGYVIFREPGADPTGKQHVSLYEGAKTSVSMEITASPFRGQDIDGQTVGSSTVIHVEWEKPNKEYNHFLITISDPASDYSSTESGEHDRVSLDLTILEPNTSYLIALQACLDPYCKNWYVADEELSVTTPQKYWQVDETTYKPSEEDELEEQTEELSGELINSEEPIEGVSAYKIVYVESVSYDQRLLMLDESGATVASATLLNP